MQRPNQAPNFRSNRARAVLFSSSTIALGVAFPAAGLILLGATPAAAEQAQAQPQTPQSPSQPDQGAEIGEVVVTAQKRAEPLQKVPVSVQVVTGHTLQVQNTNSLTDLALVVPEVHIQSSGDQFGQTIAIRGISSGARNTLYDQSVALFDDDIYYGKSVMTQGAFLDIDRIELLAGPQSTFFGNNAVGGALSLTTKKPDDHFDGYVRALYGSYGAYAVEGAASLPVTDTLAVRVAGSINGDTGWIRNVNTDKMAPANQNYAGRVTTVWKPNADFDATLKVEGTSNRISGAYNETPSQYMYCPPPAGVPKISNFCSFVLAANAAKPGSVPTGFENNLNSGLAGQFASLKTNTDQLTLNYHAAGLTFTSVTGYVHYDFESDGDNAAVGNQWVATSIVTQRYSQFSQEARVTSPDDKPVDFIVGGYFQQDHINEDARGTSPYFNSTLQALKFTGPLPTGYSLGGVQNETITSGFAAVNWHITNQWKLSFGFRATDVHKDFVGNVYYGQATGPFSPFNLVYTSAQQAFLGRFLGAPGTFPYSLNNKAVMPSVGLQYQLQPAVMLYGTYTRGFLAGGFNAGTIAPLTSFSGQTLSPTFNPEYVDAFEFGVKGKWFENRLLVNLDYFHQAYIGNQVTAQVQLLAGNYTNLAVNAGGSVSQGVELHAQWAATANFHLTADVTYLDAHYTDFTNAPPTFEQNALVPKPSFQSLNGKPLDFAPDWSGSVTAEYRADIMDGYQLTGSVTPIFTTSYYNSGGTDDPLFRIPGSVRLDAKLTLDDPSRRWAIDLIGKNLTNKIIPLSYGGNTAQGGKEEPINVAIQFRYQW